MSGPWKEFWDTYRYNGTVSGDTLLEQVGRTVNGKPVDQDEFALSIRFVADKLALNADDVLLEYCCGNGLVSFELAKLVRRVLAMDFTAHLIESAQKFRNAGNIDYWLADALEPLPGRVGDEHPNKFVMAFALGHFQPHELDRILMNLRKVNAEGPVRFLMTGIPNADRQWDFYNTPERKARFLEQEARGDTIKDGIGRWWTATEIEQVAEPYGLRVETFQEPGRTNHFRMAALLLQ